MHTIEILDTQKYSDHVMRFWTTRPQSFRFKNGEFAMLGIDGLFRAYSIVSTDYHDYLEFVSVRNVGEFTRRLDGLGLEDTLELKPKSTGSLCADYLIPKTHLVMLCTGTGIAPFVSIAHDPYTYERFETVRIYHSTRSADDLCFLEDFRNLEHTISEFRYVESVTRDEYHRVGRIWDHAPDLNPQEHAVMVCGSPELNRECRDRFTQSGWSEGNTGEMGDFMLERAFAG